MKNSYRRVNLRTREGRAIFEFRNEPLQVHVLAALNSSRWSSFSIDEPLFHLRALRSRHSHPQRHAHHGAELLSSPRNDKIAHYLQTRFNNRGEEDV